MVHWIGNSKIKTLYYNNVFEWKTIIDELESSLTGSPIDDKNTEVLVVVVEENSEKDMTEGAKASKINKSGDDMEIDIEE